jgi:hypothetical protein
LDNRWSGFRAEAGPNLFLNNRACKNGDADALDVSSYSRWMNNVFCVVGGALELSQQSRQHVIVLLARLSST